MGLKLVTGPASEPVTTLEAKEQLSIAAAVTVHDALIGRLISAARAWTEHEAQASWITQTWRLTVDRFPYGGEIMLPRPPLASVTSVAYVDADGASQTLSTDTYDVDTDGSPGRVYLAYDQSWPTTRFQRAAVTITYTAGYGDENADVPQDVRHAILMQVAHLFERRESTTEAALKETPLAVRALLAPYFHGVVPGGYVLE